MFRFPAERWKELVQADFEVLRYASDAAPDSECDPPDDGKLEIRLQPRQAFRLRGKSVIVVRSSRRMAFHWPTKSMDGNTLGIRRTLKDVSGVKIEKEYWQGQTQYVGDGIAALQPKKSAGRDAKSSATAWCIIWSARREDGSRISN